MTTPSPGTRSRLVRLTHLLSSLDDRRRVNWADNSGSDLTVVRVVSPLPASAYVVSPEVTRSGNDSFTRAVQLAAKQPQQARTGASDTTAHTTVPARYADNIFLRVPPPPVTQQPLPDTAVPRLSSGTIGTSRVSSGAPLAPASPPSTAIAQARPQPQARPPPAPRAFQPSAAGVNRNASMATLVQTAVLPGPAKSRDERRRSSGGASTTTMQSSAAIGAKIADLSPIAASVDVGADSKLAEETAFSRALLMSGPRQLADGGHTLVGTVELEETGQEGGGGAQSVTHQSVGMACNSSAASAEVEASLHSAPAEATSQRQGLQHAESASNSATAKRSRPHMAGAQASEMRSPPDRAGGTSIRSLRPASVLLSAMGDDAAARGLNSSLASLGAFLPAGSRALGASSSALAATSSSISDAAVAAIRGPRPAVRPLPSLHLPPEEESDETSQEPARAPSPPWIPSGVVGAADTKHVLVRSPVPASSPTRLDGRPAAWRSMTPPVGRDGGAAASVSPSRAERRHKPWDWDDLPTEEEDLLARPEARVAQPFVLRDGRSGAVPVPAVPPLPPAPPPSVSAAAAIRAYLHDSRSEAPASPVRPRVDANLERSTTPVRERTRQASTGGRSPSPVPFRGRTSTPQSSLDSRNKSPPDAPSAQAPRHAGQQQQQQQQATRSANQAVAVVPPPYMLQRNPAPQHTQRARAAAAASSFGVSDHRSRGRSLSADPGVSIAQALHAATARAHNEGGYLLRQSPSPGPDLRRRNSRGPPAHSPQGRTPQPRQYHPSRTRSPQPAALPSPSPPPRRRARSCCTPERPSVSPTRPSAPAAVAAPAAANTAHDVVEFVRALVNLLDPAPARLPLAAAAPPPTRPALHALRMTSPSRKVAFALPPRLVVAPARNPDVASRIWVVRDPPAEPPPAAAGRSKRVAWR